MYRYYSKQNLTNISATLQTAFYIFPDNRNLKKKKTAREKLPRQGSEDFSFSLSHNDKLKFD